MLQEYNRWKVLQIFFDDPETDFQLREISRKINLATTSAKLHLEALSKQGLVATKTHRVQKYPLYAANREAERFRFFKKINTVIMISESGLLDYLADNCTPDTIVLFGSASKGEDIKDSDIDLFLNCPERKLDLKVFEKALNRKIGIFFSEDFGKLSKELKNNIINGIVLRGYLRVFL